MTKYMENIIEFLDNNTKLSYNDFNKIINEDLSIDQIRFLDLKYDFRDVLTASLFSHKNINFKLFQEMFEKHKNNKKTHMGADGLIISSIAQSKFLSLENIKFLATISSFKFNKELISKYISNKDIIDTIFKSISTNKDSHLYYLLKIHLNQELDKLNNKKEIDDYLNIYEESLYEINL